MEREKIILVDLDGTLANCDHRVHFVEQEEKDWKSFYMGLGEDLLNAWCKEVMLAMDLRGVKSLIVTGRDEEYRAISESWLKNHDITYQSMFMRARLDRRSDYIVKKEIFEREIKEKFEVLFVLDDRKSVVKMWRELGLTCLQCDWGEF